MSVYPSHNATTNTYLISSVRNAVLPTASSDAKPIAGMRFLSCAWAWDFIFSLGIFHCLIHWRLFHYMLWCKFVCDAFSIQMNAFTHLEFAIAVFVLEKWKSLNHKNNCEDESKFFYFDHTPTKNRQTHSVCKKQLSKLHFNCFDLFQKRFRFLYRLIELCGNFLVCSKKKQKKWKIWIESVVPPFQHSRPMICTTKLSRMNIFIIYYEFRSEWLFHHQSTAQQPKPKSKTFKLARTKTATSVIKNIT